METTSHPQLRSLEGRRVSLALADGSRIDDAQLVSAGRPPLESIWVFVNGADTFLSLADVVAVWEPVSHRREAA
jgi:hypothetical protein